MRYIVAIALCLCLAGPALAQSAVDAQCLDLGSLAGQSLGALWSNSFSVVLNAHQGELSKQQAQLLQQAVDFGNSPGFDTNSRLSIHTMRGILDDARKSLTTDQFRELLARMGPASQKTLTEIGLVAPGETACSCTSGGSGCPEGFPCTVGCTTWGTGAWNGLCVRAASTTPATPATPAPTVP